MLLVLMACSGEGDTAAPEPGMGCAVDEVLEGSRCLPEACGVGVWGAMPVEEADLFIDQQAPEGGDGSQAAPLRSVEEALALQPSGTLFIAAGRYSGALRLREGATLVGRCRELVELTNDAIYTTLEVWEEGGEVRDLTLSGRHAVEIVGAPLRLESVAIQAQDYGLTAFPFSDRAVELDFEDLLIEQTGTGGGDGQAALWSAAIPGQPGPQIRGRGLTVTASAPVGLLLSGAEVDLEQLSVAMEGQQESLGVALSLDAGSSLTCRDCTIESALGVGIVVSDGASATLLGGGIHDVTQDPWTDSVAVGALVGVDGTLSLTDTVFRDIDGYGLVAVEFGQVHAEGVVFQRTGTEDGEVTAAIYADGGGAVFGRDLLIQDSWGCGVAAENWGSLELTGLTIDGVGPTLDVAGQTLAGPGVLISYGSAVLEDVTITGATTYGIVVQDFGMLEAHGLHIEQTRSHQGAPTLDLLLQTQSYALLIDTVLEGGQHGLIASRAAASFENLRLPESDGVGLVAFDTAIVYGSLIATGRQGWAVGCHECSLDLWDSVIEGTRRDSDRSLATAVGVADGQASLVRVEILQTEGIGVALEGGGLTMEDSLIQDSVLAGAFTSTGLLTLVATEVRGVESEPTVGIGVGVAAVQDPQREPGVLAMSGEVSGASHAAVWLSGQGEHQLEGAALHGGPQVDLLGTAVHGDALFVDHSSVRLSEVLLSGAQGAGLFLHGGLATLDQVSFQDNAIDLQQQACEQPMEPPADIDALICPQWDDPVLSLDFYNAVRLGDAG